MSIETGLSPEPDHSPPFAKSVALRGLLGVAAGVPYLVGFYQHNSLVFVCLDSTSRSVVVTMRMDLPNGLKPEYAASAYVRFLAQRAVQGGADTAMIFVYSEISPCCDEVSECLVGQVEQVFTAQGLDVIGAGRIASGLFAEHLACGIPEGEAVSVASGEGLATEFDLVVSGASHLTSREQLIDLVRGAPDRNMSKVPFFAHQFREQLLSSRQSASNETRRRRRMEDAIVAYLLSSPPPRPRTAPPRERQVARWLVGLADCRIREPVLRRALPGGSRMSAGAGPEAVDRMAWLVRQAPDWTLAAAGSCLAALSWQTGNGPLAVIAAERALECDATNVLADLVRRAVQSGMPPRAWVELMRSVSLQSLRSGVSDAD